MDPYCSRRTALSNIVALTALLQEGPKPKSPLLDLSDTTRGVGIPHQSDSKDVLGFPEADVIFHQASMPGIKQLKDTTKWTRKGSCSLNHTGPGFSPRK